MIIYSAISKRFYIRGSGRQFEEGTQELAVQFAGHITSTHLGSTQDYNAYTGSGSQDLCHHLSHGDIEKMVCDFLNGEISLNRFMILVGSVLRPSWSNLLFPPTLFNLVLTWTNSFADRIVLLRNHYMGNPDNAAIAADRLVNTLNSAISNLRYSDRSSNRSIQGHFDLRVHRGLTIDPFQVALLLYARIQERPAFSAESNALLNDWEDKARSGTPLVGTGLKMSEGSEVVARTKRTNNPVLGSKKMPVRDLVTRGSVRVWLPVSFDTLLYMLGVWLIAWALGLIKFPY